ncbi:MAG TPA: glycosyltransferase family 4 protein [Vicinamibacterales bacterium]|jgi:phosphatidylinositol alpha-1,6-mannosyltransferase|nr:glycosyltransferase family 4 protein [Vicinamibacterales bacterium]
MPKPILLVTELYPPVVGGSAVLLEHVYGGLVGVDVTVMTAPSAERSHGSSSPRVVSAPIDGTLRGLRPAAALAQHLRLASAIRKHARPPVVVHCARPLPEGAAGLFATLSSASRPYVCWAHGEDLAAAMTSREHAWLARRVCRNAAVMIANSHFTSRMVQGLGVSESHLRVIHPGVDPARFRPDVAPSTLVARAGRTGLVLLTVGRLQRRKGHDVVIQAIAALRHDLPDLLYVIAGNGAEQPRLQALADSLGVSGQVRFLGVVPDAELPALYTACDIFVMPNRDDGHDLEGFGIVFLEAAAAERPTIGGRSGGAPEAIADQETGLVVDGASPDEVGRAIRTLATSADLRSRMGGAGRARVGQSFTWAHASARLQALHEEMS